MLSSFKIKICFTSNSKPSAEIRLKGKIVVGTFIDTVRPDFMENYSNMVVARAKAKGTGKDKGKAA